MGFDDRTLMQDAQMDDSLYKNPDSSNILLDDTVNKDTSGEGKAMDIDFDAPPRDDGFGEGLDDFGKFVFSLKYILNIISITIMHRTEQCKISIQNFCCLGSVKNGIKSSNV